jgi:hypothetical protein
MGEGGRRPDEGLPDEAIATKPHSPQQNPILRPFFAILRSDEFLRTGIYGKTRIFHIPTLWNIRSISPWHTPLNVVYFTLTPTQPSGSPK